jgi:CBS domain-containing protein
MARTNVDAAGDMAAADVIHKRFTALPASATIGEVRDWFDASSHRKMAFLASDGHYAGSLTRSDLAGAGDAARPATEIAHDGPTVAPDTAASDAYEVAVATDALRVPVVDPDGRLIGVVAVTDDRAGFCGTS